MLPFLVIMGVGVLGLVGMALPGLWRHGQLSHGTGRALVHGRHGLHGVRGHAPAAHAALKPVRGQAPAGATRANVLRLLPEPRAIFSFMALFGAFGNLVQGLTHAGWAWCLVGAAVPALALELVAVRPVLRWAMRFEGRPSSPLAALVLEEAQAVTPFRNGKGLVSVLRDGRLIQLSARLTEESLGTEVRVGDRLRIQDVDVERERVTVSLL